MKENEKKIRTETKLQAHQEDETQIYVDASSLAMEQNISPVFCDDVNRS